MAQPISALQDDFNNNTINAFLWRVSDATAVTAASQRLNINVASTAFATLDSVNYYSLPGSSLTFQLSAGPSGVGPWNAYVRLQTADTNSYLQFAVLNGNNLSAQKTSGQVASATYDPVNHAWLRISATATTTYFWTSPDGITWTQFASTATDSVFVQNNLQFEFQVLTNGPTFTLWIDNVNLPPVPTVSPGGLKFYANVDLKAGLDGINSLDPIAPQDAATKAYLDQTASPMFAYWEMFDQAVSNPNSYSGGWANGPGLPPTQSITKLYASTRIRVKLFNVSAWATSAGGFHYYGAAVNGGAIQTITQYYFNRTGVRAAFPYGVTDFIPGSYAQVNQTGAMSVVFYISTQSGCTWNVDTNDCVYGPASLISEMP